MVDKKYYFLLIIFICSLNFIKVSSYNMPLKDKVIYLDPGHGGVDSGAIYKDILEKNINLDFCYLLKSKLENKGAKVFMTRYDDYDLALPNVSLRKRSDLENRAQVINESNSDLYLSIHLNSTTSSKWNGLQIFYDDINKENKLLAESLKESIGSKRNVTEISTKYMYKRINIPGVLIELGFLSNYQDRTNLLNDKYLDTLANKIVDGICVQFDNK